jgi:carbonic anhydrase
MLEKPAGRVGFETACYSGSLTTPPFTEGVTCINLAQPLEMAASQIQAYQ